MFDKTNAQHSVTIDMLTDPEYDDVLNKMSGFTMGWITYPSDSLERGNHFHTDPVKAPFGKSFPVWEWHPLTCAYNHTQLFETHIDTLLQVIENTEGQLLTRLQNMMDTYKCNIKRAVVILSLIDSGIVENINTL